MEQALTHHINPKIEPVAGHIVIGPFTDHMEIGTNTNQTQKLKDL